MAEIVLDGITHRYGETAALRDVTLTWDDGGAYALLGPSGCGKSTMLDIISGLLEPSEGRVRFDGIDVTATPAVQRNVAQVFQFPVLYDSMTVEQNLMFPLRNRGLARDAARARAAEIAELLEIDHLAAQKAKGLSADAKQLVSLGRALVRTDVAAILFDEPLTVIDPQKKWGIRQVLKRVHGELGHTLVYVTHDQTEALTFADEVVVMTEGEVVQKGTPEALFERPAHRFVGNFIGSPGMNFLAVGLEGSSVLIEGVPWLHVPGSVAEAHAIAAGGDGRRELDDLCVGVRPEFVRCASQARPDWPSGVVRRRNDLGTAVLSVVDTPAGTVVAKTATAEADVGERCWVGFDPDRLVLFARGRAVDGVTPIAAAAAGGGR
ncbi:MAG: ABC transporter ATP-binding protein [Actinomycetota bacterium]|nr:ABC transporter ATP-binding protein [Actinomycetota bacterium]